MSIRTEAVLSYGKNQMMQAAIDIDSRGFHVEALTANKILFDLLDSGDIEQYAFDPDQNHIIVLHSQTMEWWEAADNDGFNYPIEDAPVRITVLPLDREDAGGPDAI